MSTDQIVGQIIKKIDQALDRGAEPIAAFDADGTLWRNDIGEDFFEYQLQNKLIQNPLPSDPWKYYFDLKDEDPKKAYLWLAQVLKGHSQNEVRKWNEDCVSHLSPLPIIKEQQQLVSHLHKKGVEVFVVTASIKWAVEAAAQLYKIDYDHVIGVTVKVTDEFLTDEQDGPVTYREGKMEGLLQKTNGRKPFYASGNTMGDISLLENATHLSIAVTTVDVSHPNYKTEMELQKEATKHGWLQLKL